MPNKETKPINAKPKRPVVLITRREAEILRDARVILDDWEAEQKRRKQPIKPPPKEVKVVVAAFKILVRVRVEMEELETKKTSKTKNTNRPVP